MTSSRLHVVAPSVDDGRLVRASSERVVDNQSTSGFTCRSRLLPVGSGTAGGGRLHLALGQPAWLVSSDKLQGQYERQSEGSGTRTAKTGSARSTRTTGSAEAVLDDPGHGRSSVRHRLVDLRPTYWTTSAGPGGLCRVAPAVSVSLIEYGPELQSENGEFHRYRKYGGGSHNDLLLVTPSDLENNNNRPIMYVLTILIEFLARRC